MRASAPIVSRSCLDEALSEDMLLHSAANGGEDLAGAQTCHGKWSESNTMPSAGSYIVKGSLEGNFRDTETN